MYQQQRDQHQLYAFLKTTPKPPSTINAPVVVDVESVVASTLTAPVNVDTPDTVIVLVLTLRVPTQLHHLVRYHHH